MASLHFGYDNYISIMGLAVIEGLMAVGYSNVRYEQFIFIN